MLRECLSGETVTFEGDFYDVKRFRLGLKLGDRRPKIALAALNKQMLRLGGELADVVLLNYLPATLVPWCVERIRAGGDAEIHAYVHCAVTDRDRYADLARKDLLNYAVVPAYATQFERAGFVDEVRHFQKRWAARDRDGALAAISDDWVDAIQIMGDEQHVRDAVQAYADNGVDVPIVFALPWGEDRRGDGEPQPCARSPDGCRRVSARRTSPCPGPSARNDCTPVARVLGAEHLDERVALRGRARRRASRRARGRSRAWRGPSRRPRPCASSAAQWQRRVLFLARRRRRGRRGRSRAPPSARTWRPLQTISLARAGPTSRVSRCVPPAPGMMPSRISGWPRRAVSPATRRSHAHASSSPPPSA